MTILEFLNFYFFQWFFVRLAKVHDDQGAFIKWKILKVFPLTGWDDRPYKYW